MQKLIFVRGWAILILPVLLCGCYPIYYASSAHNVPLLQEKHEVRISGGVTMTEYLAGPELQVAYAATQNLGLIASGTYLAPGDNSSGYGYQAELGAGYFKPFHKWGVAEVYAGTALAKVVNAGYPDPLELHFIKPFIQPALGFSSPYLDMAFSPRIAWVHYNEPFVLDYEVLRNANGQYLVDANGYAQINVLKEKQTFFAFEPGFTVRGGWKFIKLQLQVARSLQDIPNGDNLSVNLSFSANLAARFRKPLRDFQGPNP